MTKEIKKLLTISPRLLPKKNNLQPLEKLAIMASYFDESELANNINNYINMEKTYQEIGDQLLEAGFKIPSSKDVVSFFKNKILEIYYNDYNPCEGFITWLNS